MIFGNQLLHDTSLQRNQRLGHEGIEEKTKITMDFILEGFLDPVKDKVGKCSLAKEIWDKIHNLYLRNSILS
jgi:hypothetical protein